MLYYLQQVVLVEEKIQEAVEYANSSSKLEDLQLSNEELMKIINDIKEGKNDDSFLYAIVKKALYYNGKELKKENNGEHRRY